MRMTVAPGGASELRRTAIVMHAQVNAAKMASKGSERRTVANVLSFELAGASFASFMERSILDAASAAAFPAALRR